MTSRASYNPSISTSSTNPSLHYVSYQQTSKTRTNRRTDGEQWDQLLRLPSPLHRRDWQKQRVQIVRVWRNYVNKQSVDFQWLSIYPGASSWDFYRIFKQVKADRRWTALFYQIWREYTHLHWHEKRKVPLCQHPMAKPFIQKRLRKPV